MLIKNRDPLPATAYNKTAMNVLKLYERNTITVIDNDGNLSLCSTSIFMSSGFEKRAMVNTIKGKIKDICSFILSSGTVISHLSVGEFKKTGVKQVLERVSKRKNLNLKNCLNSFKLI